jgi:hypothetical protein
MYNDTALGAWCYVAERKFTNYLEQNSVTIFRMASHSRRQYSPELLPCELQVLNMVHMFYTTKVTFSLETSPLKFSRFYVQVDYSCQFFKIVWSN